MITGLNHITLAVSNLETSFTFYRDILQCRPLARWRRGAYLLAGDTWLCLSLDPTLSSTPSLDYTHLATVPEAKFVEWRSRLTQNQVPQWKENTSVGIPCICWIPMAIS